MECPTLAEMRTSFCADENRRLPPLPCTSLELGRAPRQPKCHSHGGYSSFAQVISVDDPASFVSASKLKASASAVLLSAVPESFAAAPGSLSASLSWPDTDSDFEFEQAESPWRASRERRPHEPVDHEETKAAENEEKKDADEKALTEGIAEGIAKATEVDETEAERASDQARQQLQDLLTAVGAAVDALVALGTMCPTPTTASIAASLSQNLAALTSTCHAANGATQFHCMPGSGQGSADTASPFTPFSGRRRRSTNAKCMLDLEKLTGDSPLPQRRASTDTASCISAPVLLGARGYSSSKPQQNAALTLDLDNLVLEVPPVALAPRGAERSTTLGDGMAAPGERRADEQPTTVMIQNLPADVTQSELMDSLNQGGFQGSYNFCYVPRAAPPAEDRNQGFAFVNFETALMASSFKASWHATYLQQRGRDGRALKITAANVQGLEANVAKWGDPRAQKNRRPENRPFISVASLPKKVVKLECSRRLPAAEAAAAATMQEKTMTM